MNWRVENSKGDNPDFFYITYCDVLYLAVYLLGNI